MNRLIFNMYLRSPFIIKRLFANIEAIRRDKYRKFRGNTESIKKDHKQNIFEENYFENLKRINDLIESSVENVSYYRNLGIQKINCIEEYEQIPILTKNIIRRENYNIISEDIQNKKELWKGSSSGSTGAPLRYYRDKNSVTKERFNYEQYYRYCGCNLNTKRTRISGVKITNFNRKKPPFWVYIDRYKQLQCSTYHISENSFKHYLDAFKKYNISFGTGFPSGWTELASLMLKNNIKYEGLSAIITDSEGLSLDNKKKIEKAFSCKVYQAYGLGEVGMCAVQCENGNYHILSKDYYVEVIDTNGSILKDGEEGEIIVTDFNSHKYPFIRYATGDLGIMHHNDCGCGMKTPYLSKITGRVEDYILTKDGRKITRISSIMKSAVGIKESQIIQISKSEIIINIVEDDNFERESMELVIKNAKELLGDMEISWKLVEQLEKMPSGKVKFLIRKI